MPDTTPDTTPIAPAGATERDGAETNTAEALEAVVERLEALPGLLFSAAGMLKNECEHMGAGHGVSLAWQGVCEALEASHGLPALLAQYRADRERIRGLEEALSGLLDALGSGETGDDCTEWCVACRITRSSTPEYKSVMAAWREGDYSQDEPPIPHRTPCPLDVARQTQKGAPHA